MNGFIQQLISEKINFTVNWDRQTPDNNSLIITTNNESQYNYFVNWFSSKAIHPESNVVEILMDSISDFPQITWSGLIPPTK